MLNTNQSNRKNIWKFGIILPFVTAFMLLFQVETIAQEKESKTIEKEIKKDVIVQNEDFESIYNSPYESDTKENLKRVFVINGKVYTKDDLKNKNIAQFKDNVTIDKIGPKEAVKLYGNRAKDGAVIFKGDWKIIDNVIEQEKGEIAFKDDKTISKFSKSSEIEIISEIKNEEKDPLFIVNGKEMRRSEIVHKSMTIDGDIVHYEGESAIEKFGEKGKDGVYVLNGKTTFTDDPKLLKTVPENPEKIVFTLDNGDGCVLFNGYMLKIPDYPSINLSQSKNKVFIDDKQFHKDMFYNYDHKNLKSVNVLKMFKDDVQVGYSIYFTTK